MKKCFFLTIVLMLSTHSLVFSMQNLDSEDDRKEQCSLNTQRSERVNLGTFNSLPSDQTQDLVLSISSNNQFLHKNLRSVCKEFNYLITSYKAAQLRGLLEGRTITNPFGFNGIYKLEEFRDSHELTLMSLSSTLDNSMSNNKSKKKSFIKSVTTAIPQGIQLLFTNNFKNRESKDCRDESNLEADLHTNKFHVNNAILQNNIQLRNIVKMRNSSDNNLRIKINITMLRDSPTVEEPLFIPGINIPTSNICAGYNMFFEFELLSHFTRVGSIVILKQDCEIDKK